MIKYFVVAADGGKYGPADVATLNRWIAEGRLNSKTLLEDEGGTRVEAGGVPALKFAAHAGHPLPGPPPPTANPYDLPTPGIAGPRPFSSQYMPPMRTTSSMSGAGPVVLGWICTIGAPILIYFTYIGIFLVIIGFRAAASLWQSGQRGLALPMIIVNVLSVILWIGMRVMLFSGYGAGPHFYR